MTITMEGRALSQVRNSSDAAEWLEGIIRQGIRLDPEELSFSYLEPYRRQRRDFASTRDQIHVTDLAHECPRPVFFRLQGLEPDFERTKQHWSHEGYLKELWVRALLRRISDMRWRVQVPVQDKKLGIQGYIDMISPKVVNDFGETFRILIDVKSRSLAIRGTSACPSQRDVDQVKIYTMLLRSPVPIFPVLLYVYRQDLSQFDAWPVQIRSDWAPVDLVQRVQEIRDALETGEPPPMRHRFAPVSYPCKWETANDVITCPWHSRCWKNAPRPSRNTRLHGDALDRIREYFELAQLKSLLDATRREIEARQKKIRAWLDPLLDGPGDYPIPALEEEDVDLLELLEAWVPEDALEKAKEAWSGQGKALRVGERKGYIHSIDRTVLKKRPELAEVLEPYVRRVEPATTYSIVKGKA